jgi:hypothetical protein
MKDTHISPIEIQPQVTHQQVAAPDLGTTLTPAEAPASQNLKEAAKFGGLAVLSGIHIAATVMAERAERKSGKPNMTNPLHTMASFGALSASIMGVTSEVKAGLGKRRAAKK